MPRARRRGGRRLTPEPGPPAPFVYDPPRQPLRILHRDADLLIVDKPAGLLSVPGKTADLADCVASRARALHPGALVVHRLDMSTSGVIALALNPKAQRNLGIQFQKRITEKTYLAEVWGDPPGEAGDIDLPLSSDWVNRPRQKVNHAEGRPALTRWRVLERRAGGARMELRPVTGRSHQLRVHMEELGCPILGDHLYGPPESRAAAPRLMLHALRLTLRHPADGKPATFEAECPF